MNSSSQTSDAGFKFIRENTEKINRVINMPNAAQRHIYTVIYNREIYPVIQETFKVPNKEIDWNTLQKTVEKKYTHEYAYEPVLYAKIQWYQYREQTGLNTRKYCELCERI